MKNYCVFVWQLIYTMPTKTQNSSLATALIIYYPIVLKQYARYLPKQAIVYLKAIPPSVSRKTKEESTSVITNSKAGFIAGVLKFNS